MRNRTLTHTLATVALTVALPAIAGNSPMTELMTLPRTDYVNVGVNGIGAAAVNGGGVGTIELSGVSGSVTLALLYWEGIDIDYAPDDFIDGDADYDEAEIQFDGVPVSGTQLYAHGANNNWPFTAPGDPPPPPSAGLYRADVTALVQAGGNRSYLLQGLADGGGHSANGVSLVVYFDDGDPANDFHVVHYEGMQSNEGDAWQFVFDIDYAGGAVEAIFHVADGQASLGDGILQLNVTPGVPGSNPDYNTIRFTPTHYDGLLMWAGESVPGMAFPRAGNGLRLWDIRRLPLTGGFGPPGVYSVATVLNATGDALSLLIAQVVTPADADETNVMLTPTPFDFGDAVRDTVGPSQTFTLLNLQPHPITISDPPTVGANVYQITAQTCADQTLAPGATCTVDVACAPDGLGQAPPSALEVEWTPPGSSTTRTSYAPLACYGIRAAQFSRLTLAPSSCDFGQVPAGTVSATRHFTASNTGNLPINITEAHTSLPFVVQLDTCAGLVLQPGQTCQADVAYASDWDGEFEEGLYIHFSASDDESANGVALLNIVAAGTTGNPVFADGFDPPGCE